MAHPIWEHVEAGLCDDPDCEVHNLEVGFEEHTMTSWEAAVAVVTLQRVKDELDRLIDHFTTIGKEA